MVGVEVPAAGAAPVVAGAAGAEAVAGVAGASCELGESGVGGTTDGALGGLDLLAARVAGTSAAAGSAASPGAFVPSACTAELAAGIGAGVASSAGRPSKRGSTLSGGRLLSAQARAPHIAPAMKRVRTKRITRERNCIVVLLCGKGAKIA